MRGKEKRQVLANQTPDMHQTLVEGQNKLSHNLVPLYKHECSQSSVHLLFQISADPVTYTGIGLDYGKS